MPGNHGIGDVDKIYRDAYEEGIRIQNMRQEQREQYCNANLQEDRRLLSEVRKARRSRDDRSYQTHKDNPMNRNLSRDNRRAEAHNRRTETVLSRDELGKHQTSHDEYFGFIDQRGVAPHEEELAQLRLERRRLLERQQQLKAALELRRRVDTGKRATTVKSLCQVSIENGYGRVPGSGPPSKKPGKALAKGNAQMSQSLPSLGSGVSQELVDIAFPLKGKTATSPPSSPKNTKSVELK